MRSWLLKVSAVALFLLQLLCLVPMLIYHGGVVHATMLLGLFSLWASLLFLFTPKGVGAFRAFSRTGFAVIIACAPFCWYSLHYLHGCVVTFEIYPWFLGFLILGPPVHLRLFLSSQLEGESPHSRPSGAGQGLWVWSHRSTPAETLSVLRAWSFLVSSSPVSRPSAPPGWRIR